MEGHTPAGESNKPPEPEESPEVTRAAGAMAIYERVESEKQRLDDIIAGIMADHAPGYAYLILGIMIVLNIAIMISTPQTYLVLWILASLYLYLFYPALPLILSLLQYLRAPPEEKTETRQMKTLLIWVKNLQVIQNRDTGVRLAIRFFILGIVPLTGGIIIIYTSSLLAAIYLGTTSGLPWQTALLILVQCLGILIFYLNIFIFRQQFYLLTRSSIKIAHKNWIRYLVIAIISCILIVVASGAVIILLIAIVLPGITLGIYVDAANFVENRTNILILLLLISQCVIMQWMQSIFSRTIALDIAGDLRSRLEDISRILYSPEHAHERLTIQDSPDICRRAVSLLLESRIHAITRTQLAWMFPTYAVFISFEGLYTIQTLNDLEGMFSHRR